MRIAKQFFSPSEQDYINQDETRFFAIWVLKECYIKLKGLSVFDMAAAPSFIHSSGRLRLQFDDEIPLSFFLYSLDGGPGKQYMLAAAVEGKGEFRPEIQWFSQDFLPVSSIAEINAAHRPALTVRPKM
jgi:hypothetical protein